MTSEAALLRAEIARLHKENNLLGDMLVSMFETATSFIESRIRIDEFQKKQIESMLVQIAGLEKRLGITSSWNGRPSESKEYVKTRAEFKKQSERYEAEKKGLDPDAAVPVRKVEGQLGHKGVSRPGKPSAILEFEADICRCCGVTYLLDHRTINKRTFGGKDRTEKGEECLMYLLRVKTCYICNIATIPHTDVIKGSAFRPEVRGAVRTYNAGGTSVGTSKSYMADLGGTTISTGAISNCTTAMADEADCDVLAVARHAHCN